MRSAFQVYLAMRQPQSRTGRRERLLPRLPARGSGRDRFIRDETNRLREMALTLQRQRR